MRLQPLNKTFMEKEIANIGDDLPDWFRDAMSVARKDLVADVGGVPIRYFEWGNKANPPVILLHGFLSHRRCWSFIAPLLAEKYHLIAFDLSGMGDSGEADDYTLDARIKEISGFIDRLNLSQKPFLVGHSFGGGIYTHFTQQNPDVVRALIACDVFMLRPQDVEGWMSSERAQRLSSANKRRIYPDWQTIYGRYVLSPPQPVACPFLFEYMAKHSVKQIDEGWTWKFDPRIMQRDEKERFWWTENSKTFAALNTPKAIIHGAKSTLVAANIIEYLNAESKTDFPAIAIADAHHHIMLDKPLEFAAAIDKVLTDWL